MSERGVFAVDRGVFGHSRFADEPFTEREAWIWMIGQAAFRAHSRRVGRVRVSLKRGQFAHSTRYMADQWKWSEASVRRFIAMLKEAFGADDAMIDANNDAGVTLITIRNYGRYQRVSIPDNAANDAQSDADMTQTRRKEEDTKGTKSDDDEGRNSLVSDDAFALTAKIGEACGFKDAIDWPTGWGTAAPMRVQTWLSNGWRADQILPACKDTMSRKRDGPPGRIEYFEKPIAQFIARQAAPLPKVEIPQQETIHATHRSGNSGGNGLSRVIQQLRAGAEDDRGEEASRAPPRLLSHG